MIRRLSILLAAVVLWGCGGVSAPVVAPTPSIYPNTLPTSPWWHLSGLTTYAQYTAPGAYDAATGAVTETGPEVATGVILSVTDSPTTLPTDPTQVGVAHCVIPPITTGQPPCNDNSNQIERQTTQYIGEGSNVYSALVDPPEPILSNAPYVGESFYVTSALTGGGTLLTEYRTLAVGATVTTVLVENPGTATERVYEYVFDGGLASVAYGNVAPDGSVQVTMLRRVGTGVNP